MTPAVGQRRGAKAPCGSEKIDRFEETGFTSPIRSDKQMPVAVGMPADVSEIAKASENDLFQQIRSASA